MTRRYLPHKQQTKFLKKRNTSLPHGRCGSCTKQQVKHYNNIDVYCRRKKHKQHDLGTVTGLALFRRIHGMEWCLENRRTYILSKGQTFIRKKLQSSQKRNGLFLFWYTLYIWIPQATIEPENRTKGRLKNSAVLFCLCPWTKPLRLTGRIYILMKVCFLLPIWSLLLCLQDTIVRQVGTLTASMLNL